MSENLQKYQEIQVKLRTLREEAAVLMKSVFSEGCNEFFRENPNLVSFSWTQYTPYFNDGDSCEFSAHTDYINFVFMDGDVEVECEDVGAWSLRDNSDYLDDVLKNSDQNRQTALKVIEFLSTFSDDDYEVTFGDHVRVTVINGTIDVDSYEHD